MFDNFIAFSGGGLYAPLQKRGDAFWRGLIYWIRYILSELSTCLYNQQAQLVLLAEHGFRLKKKLSYAPQVAKALYKQVDKTLLSIRTRLVDWLLEWHRIEERQDGLIIELLIQTLIRLSSKLQLERLTQIVQPVTKVSKYKEAQLRHQLTTDQNTSRYIYTTAPLSIAGVI